MFDDEEFTQLIKEFRGGGEPGPQAWANFLEKAFRRAAGYALASGMSEDDADDIGQTVIETLIKKIQRYDDNRPFLPWLKSITRSKQIDFWRKNKRYAPLLEEALGLRLANHDDDPAQFSGALAPIAQVQLLRDHASEQQRATIDAYLEHNGDTKKIARTLGVTRSRVYQILKGIANSIKAADQEIRLSRF